MSTLKALKQAQHNAVRQQAVLNELEALVKSIDRSEKMIRELKAEVAAVNVQHQSRATTRDDIAYLEDLLRCAKTKLVWEKADDRSAAPHPSDSNRGIRPYEGFAERSRRLGA